MRLDVVHEGRPGGVRVFASDPLGEHVADVEGVGVTGATSLRAGHLREAVSVVEIYLARRGLAQGAFFPGGYT